MFVIAISHYLDPWRDVVHIALPIPKGSSTVSDLMEPTPETYQAMGTLCVTRSYLERQTERTINGMLGLDQQLSRIFIWKLGIQQRCNLIKDEAGRIFKADEAIILKTLMKNILIVSSDRNIIIHGLVHATIIKTHKDEIIDLPINKARKEQFGRVPCWTIFMGEGKAKNYKISTESVNIVSQNVQFLAKRLADFNNEHNFNDVFQPTDIIEEDWPQLLL